MRTRITALFLAVLLLASCGGAPEPASTASGREDEPSPASEPAQAYEFPEPEPEPEPDPTPEPDPEREPPADPETAAFQAALDEILWNIETASTPEDILYAYFELQYLGYLSMRQVDLTPVLDMTQYNTYNIERWMANLVQRRRLLYQENLCFIDTERHDYSIRFIEDDEIDDIRLDFWKNRDIPEGEVQLHFVVEGESGKAYPPLMAVNSQHTVRMVPDGDGWKISLHYFPGAVRKYFRTTLIEYRDEQEVLEELYEEFTPYDDELPLQPRQNSRPYNGVYAAYYAEMFTENLNPGFYHVGDWAGNCMNFVSQCVLHGFGSGKTPDSSLNNLMTPTWFSGGGGGTSAWENVDYFWDFAKSGESMRCEFPKGPWGLRAGDIIQTRSSNIRSGDDPDDFTHALLVVDADTLMLAQNTPACFVYYSDLVDTERRFIRPGYMN